MRDYGRFDAYLNTLSRDIYEQPEDPGHTAWADEAIRTFGAIPQTVRRVLDVGCGQGFAKPMFEALGYDWRGCTLGPDVGECHKKGLPVDEADMTFLPYGHGEFDMIFSRHVLEHSPFPLITLMEWHRVAAQPGYLLLVAPAPEFWKYRGKNHYSVLPFEMLMWLVVRGGWHPIHTRIMTTGDEVFKKHGVHVGAKRQTTMYDGWGNTYLIGVPEPCPVEYWFLCERIVPTSIPEV